MKKFTALLFVVLILSIAHAQSICESFDNCGNLTNYQREHTFDLFGNGNSGCLSNWEVTSGTPSVYGTFVSPYSGTDYALFGIHNNTTVEGAALKFDFLAGKTYNVTLALYNYNGSPMNIDFYLLQSAIPYTYNYNTGSSAIPAVPGGALKVDSLVQFSAQQWQVVNFTVTNLSQNYSRFWLRQSGANNFLFVDSLCINEVIETSSYCENFDECGTLSPNQREHAFNFFGNGQPGCLSNWEVTSGTPSIYGSFVAPYSGTDYALLGIHNSSTVEGIALKYDFLEGKTYTISMALYNYNGSAQNIDFYLLTSPIPYTYTTSVGSSPIPAVPAGALLMDSIRQFTSQQWQVHTFTFSNLRQDYNRFWIRQYGANNFLFLDSLCITEQTITGIKEANHQPSLALYPNPASNELYIRGLGNETVQISIFDLQGKLLMMQESAGKIDISQLASGTYIAGIKQRGTTTFKRWVKL
jgi:hypothetical protein